MKLRDTRSRDVDENPERFFRCGHHCQSRGNVWDFLPPVIPLGARSNGRKINALESKTELDVYLLWKMFGQIYNARRFVNTLLCVQLSPIEGVHFIFPQSREYAYARLN